VQFAIEGCQFHAIEVMNTIGLSVKNFVLPGRYIGSVFKKRLKLSTAILKRRFSSKVKWWKRDDVFTVPNIITSLRIAASPVLAYAIVYDLKFIAVGGCVVFAFSDWLDGYLAKRWNQCTLLGAYLDPLADKFMIGSLCIGLVMKDLIPIPLATLIISRDIFLASCAFYIRSVTKSADSDYMDFISATSVAVVPSDISKVS
jgi:cardiolipin synthase (CMP-forming)